VQDDIKQFLEVGQHVTAEVQYACLEHLSTQLEARGCAELPAIREAEAESEDGDLCR
jgi:hypothetical protein